MMKAFLMIGALLVTLATANSSTAQQVPPRPDTKNVQKRGPAPPLVQLIEGIYVNSLRQQAKQAEITDEQIARMLPFLRQYLRDRNEIGGTRRLRAQRDLQQAFNRGAPDEELGRLIQQFDRIDADVQAAQAQFLSSTDPILTMRQRAWLRVWQIRVEERIRRLIQEGAGVPPPPGT